MKKKYGLMILTVITLLMVGCSKKLSDEDLVTIWDDNVSVFSNNATEMMTSKDLDQETLLNNLKKNKVLISKSDESLNEAKGNEKMITDLKSINKQIILSFDMVINDIEGEVVTPEQEESSFLVGSKVSDFANKYNDGNLPDSFIVMINTSEKIQNKISNEQDAALQKSIDTLEQNMNDLDKASKDLQKSFGN